MIKKGDTPWNKGKGLGLYKSRFYRCWINMKARCLNPKDIEYKNYGKRGITIDENWLTFTNFYKDMFSSYDDNLTLDRIDNDGNYCKDNCKWSTRKEQANNRKNTAFIEYCGIRDTLKNWAEFYKIDYYVLYRRIFESKWNLERAFFTPIRKYPRR